MADTETVEEVVHLEGHFDAPALCRIQDLFPAEQSAARVVLDFHRGSFCHPLALAKLFEFLARSNGFIRTRGLCQQHHVLLGYLGFGSAA